MSSDFEKASKEKRTTLVGEFIGFVSDNKKWFLVPLLLCMLGIGALVVLAGTGAAPFIYTLF